jgi:hypothetical protein
VAKDIVARSHPLDDVALHEDVGINPKQTRSDCSAANQRRVRDGTPQLLDEGEHGAERRRQPSEPDDHAARSPWSTDVLAPQIDFGLRRDNLRVCGWRQRAGALDVGIESGRC